METKQLKLAFDTLDSIRHVDADGEYWSARELYPFLGYTRWEKFVGVIDKAKEACTNSGGNVMDHFIPQEKAAGIGSGATREIEDIRMTRYASYLTAVNGDPSKEEVAVAQTYFVTKTRQIELVQQRMDELERLTAREKLKITEKEFSNVIFSRGVDGPGIGLIRRRGDQELFGLDRTANVKKSFGVPDNKPLADVLPTVTLKAKDLATAMTTENARQKNLYGLQALGTEHVKNNKGVREALTKSGIFPEQLPAAEDIKSIEARHKKELRELREAQKRELAAATEYLELPITGDVRETTRRPLPPKKKAK